MPRTKKNRQGELTIRFIKTTKAGVTKVHGPYHTEDDYRRVLRVLYNFSSYHYGASTTFLDNAIAKVDWENLPLQEIQDEVLVSVRAVGIGIQVFGWATDNDTRRSLRRRTNLARSGWAVEKCYDNDPRTCDLEF
jgi:hypothetical protein